MQPPEVDELEGNPIKLLTEAEQKDYYCDAIFDFNSYGRWSAAYHGPEIPEYHDHQVRTQNERLLAAVEKIRAITDKKAYDEHTDLHHDYWRNPEILQNYFICKNKAFLKLAEVFDMLQFDTFEGRSLRSFHLCEGPGFFIDAVYLNWMRYREWDPDCQTTWDFAANTLNPYFENTSCFHKLVDDSHIRGHKVRWYFGPSDDGDVMKFTEEYLIREELAGTFDLVTADGSTNTQGQEGFTEHIVHDLLKAEVEVALKLLRSKGRFIIKMYRFCIKKTRDLMMLLAENFTRIRAIKPMSSRPGSSERYIICDNFGGRMNLSERTLLLCDEFFLEKQLKRINEHVETFQNDTKKFSWAERKLFLEEMRKRYYTAENVMHYEAIQNVFPTNVARTTSPWMKVYGHDLIRRLKNADMEIAVAAHIGQADIRQPDESQICTDFLIQCSLDKRELLITSDIPLEVKDSLFIDPIAFQAMQKQQPRKYYDFMQKASTIKDVPEEEWRRNFKISGGNYTIEMGENITIEHVLTALLEGLNKEMYTFTMNNLPDSGPPLWLSRCSASTFFIFYTIFEMMEVGQRQVRWAGMKYIPTARDLIKRILKDMLRHPAGTSIRSFIPLKVMDQLHPLICHRNLTHLTLGWANHM